MRDRIGDIAVVGGLAALALWTYVFLPLVYFHT
jgi:hypothetical protein